MKRDLSFVGTGAFNVLAIALRALATLLSGFIIGTPSHSGVAFSCRRLASKASSFGYTKSYLLIFVIFITLVGCKKNSDPIDDGEGNVTVRFNAKSDISVIPIAPYANITKESKTAYSKAALIPQKIKAGSTIRIVVYERDAANVDNADISTDKYVTTNTYQVTDDGSGYGSGLAACNVDGDGSISDLQDGASEMILKGGTYDFYAYSPALPLNSDNQNVSPTHIINGVDFMGLALKGKALDMNEPDVNLLFDHKGSKVSVKAIRGDNAMNFTQLSMGDVEMSKSALSPITANYTLGSDFTPTCGDIDSKHTITEAHFNYITPNTPNDGVTGYNVMLPKTSDVLPSTFDVTINSVLFKLKAELASIVFVQGTQYVLVVTIMHNSASLTLHVISWDEVIDSNPSMGGDNAGIHLGTWENIDWSGSVGGGGGFDPVSGAIIVDDWDAVTNLPADLGKYHTGMLGDWDDNDQDNPTLGMKPDISNSAMVTAGGSVLFNINLNTAIASGGKGVPTSSTVLPTTTAGLNAMSAAVLWQDVSGGVIKRVWVSPNDKTLAVTTKKGTTGNAIVALYSGANGTGTILWSWHIWVTDYQPNKRTNSSDVWAVDKAFGVKGGEVHSYNGATWTTAANPAGTGGYKDKVIMDRNLGATRTFYGGPISIDAPNPEEAWGMLYQWGRKDPMPRATMTNPTADGATTIPLFNATGGITPTRPVLGMIASATSIAVSVQKPLSFIKSASGDWNSSPSAVLWGNGGAKGIYDPCPKGWKVSKTGTWDNFGSETDQDRFKYKQLGINWVSTAVSGDFHRTHGRLYAPATGMVSAWYPASGFRFHITGVLSGVGTAGISWSSSVSDSNVFYLDFYPTTLLPNCLYFRSYSFPVRCVQE